MSITVRGAAISGGQRQPILQRVDMTIPKGSLTLIIGRNGAGKSTLLDALSGLIRLDEGEIQVDEQPLWLPNGRLNEDVVRRIGNVFQYPEQQLFASTVERELAYSLRYLKLSKEEAAKRISWALDSMGLDEELKHELPHLLSGGQKRRVVLASTIAARPEWLMLDEPTAGLDREGVDALLDFLLAEKKMGKSIVITTHDLESLLPHADHIVVLHDKTVLAEISREELWRDGVTDLLVKAGLRVPLALAVSDMLRQEGISLPDGWPSPREVAETIVKHRLSGISSERSNSTPQSSAESAERCSDDTQSAGSTERLADISQQLPDDPAERGTGFLHRLDPRSKWLFYMLLSIGILFQSSWLGLLIGSIAAVSIIVYAKVSWRPLLKVTGPLLIFILISVLVSGFSLKDGQIRLEAVSSLKTMFELLKIVVVSMLGVTLAAITTQLMMKKAIEQSLRFLKPLRVPVEAIALGCSLILRFIPVLMHEYHRFSKIVKARGKEQLHGRGIRFRQMPALFIPLIVSLIQTASHLTIAMQARGLTSLNQPRTSRTHLRMERSDWKVVIAGVASFALLLWFELLQ